MTDADGFVEIAAEDELWDGEMESYDVDGAEILLVRVDGEYRAYDGICPHQQPSLVEGRLEGSTLTAARTSGSSTPAPARGSIRSPPA